MSVIESLGVALPRYRMDSNLSKHLNSISFEGGAFVVVNSNIWLISFTSTDSVKCNGSTVADFSKSSSLFPQISSISAKSWAEGLT
jgi:hypothetical protein